MTNEELPTFLSIALRQYHHINSDKFVFGYDIEEIHKIIKTIKEDTDRIERKLLNKIVSVINEQLPLQDLMEVCKQIRKYLESQ